MPSLKKYWFREFVLGIMVLGIVAIPFASAFIFEGLWRRWMVVVGIVGFIVYYYTQDKVMPSATYNKLGNKQKRVVLWYRLTLCVIFLFLILAIEMKVILRVFMGVMILGVGFLSTKRLVNLRRR